AEHVLLEQKNIYDGKRDESHFDVEDRIGKLRGRVGEQKQSSGNGVYPEASPHEREELLHRRQRHASGNTEYAQIDRGIDTRDKSQANRVKEQNQWVGQEGVRLSHPGKETGRFKPGKKIPHVAKFSKS